MDEFIEDLRSGEIHFRDKWQFELKSEFTISSAAPKTPYIQEFYFFIPNSLQINQSTYPKECFYQDLTNFIRFKTPSFHFLELFDENKSPLKDLYNESLPLEGVEDGLKLFGNIFRSSLRDEIIDIVDGHQDKDLIEKKIFRINSSLEKIKHSLTNLQHQLLKKFPLKNLETSFRYLKEFIDNTSDYYLTGLLDVLQRRESDLTEASEKLLIEMILAEPIKTRFIPGKESLIDNEEILYRKGLLKKYMMDALMLPVTRASIQDRYGSLIGSFSAGIAMLAYVLLFIWYGNWFVINSTPFLILTVIAYILKDRLKETLKGVSYKRALEWLSDYNTEIRSPDGAQILGSLKESFIFLPEEKLPLEIMRTRSEDFHEMLKLVKRPEQVIYFKRSVELRTEKPINIILRFNIHDFVSKASDPFHSYVTLDRDSKQLVRLRLPKVYHVNIILKNRFTEESGKEVIELKKFRLIIDKTGIKSVEQILRSSSLKGQS